jgi:hypothetical protein
VVTIGFWDGTAPKLRDFFRQAQFWQSLDSFATQCPLLTGSLAVLDGSVLEAERKNTATVLMAVSLWHSAIAR